MCEIEPERQKLLASRLTNGKKPPIFMDMVELPQGYGRDYTSKGKTVALPEAMDGSVSQCCCCALFKLLLALGLKAWVPALYYSAPPSGGHTDRWLPVHLPVTFECLSGVWLPQCHGGH